MLNTIYNNKKVIWESKTKRILAIVSCFSFTVVNIWLYDPQQKLLYWLSIIFWGCGICFLLWQLLNPKNVFVDSTSPIGEKISTEQEMKYQEDFGFFEYTHDGFFLQQNSGKSFYKWVDMETVIAYKQDRFVTDEMILEITFHNHSSLWIEESILGWYQFNKKLQKAIPQIPENWEFEVVQPALKTTLTLLFDQRGRTLKQVQYENNSPNGHTT